MLMARNEEEGVQGRTLGQQVMARPQRHTRRPLFAFAQCGRGYLTKGSLIAPIRQAHNAIAGSGRALPEVTMSTRNVHPIDYR